MKLFFFLRIQDGSSLLVHLVSEVFKLLKNFLLFFIIFNLQLGMIFLIFFKILQNFEFNQGNILVYILMSFGISTGYFQHNNYHKKAEVVVIYTGIIWLIALLIGIIMIMNFIIDVISEFYQRNMQKLVLKSYIAKENFIDKNENLYRNDDLKTIKYFPNFIIFRNSLNKEIDYNWEQKQFIKYLKYSIRKRSIKFEQERNICYLSIQTNNNYETDKNPYQITNMKIFMKNLLYSIRNMLKLRRIARMNYSNNLKEEMSLMYKLKGRIPKPQGFKNT
ncbi:UNKNOWN [Stylonychia lemnae]|uniref:Uncharacterized protein n=1 Tax=Stylonychia lemnae TaxID=5949 RepID=A0A078AP20_STYLE|nr:UNKNOWN [Stylonychia lemnae]|eukprot:CDW84120.1 UNKNOWN [Stylonychia lemnae]